MRKLFTARKIVGNNYIMFHKVRLYNRVSILVGISFFSLV